METAKRERDDQLRRYQEREGRQGSSGTRRRSLAVVRISDEAKLRDASIKNRLDEVSEILLHRGSKITKEVINEAFLQACICGNEEIACLLLQNDAFVDYQDDDLWTAAHYASARGHKGILHLLFQYNIDTTLLDVDGNFALDYAKDPSIRLLISEQMAHSGVYEEDLPSIRTRQLKAMTAAVRSAIMRGKNLSLPNKNGITPLHTAAAYGYYEVTQLLVESGGVPLTVTDSSGCTPLHVAMKYGQTQVAKYLLQQGARMEESNYDVGLNLEALSGQNSPQPLSNRWKLKDITADDAQRERSWLRQHIGLVQDVSMQSREAKGTPLVEVGPMPAYVHPQSMVYPHQMNVTFPETVPGDARRKISASLQPIPEMIYESYQPTTNMPRPPPTQYIEDIYDCGGVVSNNRAAQFIPSDASIYDDLVISTSFHGNIGSKMSDRQYNEMVQGVAGYHLHDHTPIHLEETYDDVVALGVAIPTSPRPYEKFVRLRQTEMAPPPPVIKPKPLRSNARSDSNIMMTSSVAAPAAAAVMPPNKQMVHRSVSAGQLSNGGVPEAWLPRMLPQLRPAPILRRDSTPSKAPPPVPNRRMANIRDIPPPLPPPRQQVLAMPLTTPPLVEPPPTYAAVLQSPEQFTLSPPPKPHPKPPRYMSEPHQMVKSKPVLRKIASTPVTLESSGSSIILFNGRGGTVTASNEQQQQQQENDVSTVSTSNRTKARPYTFRTSFQ